MSAVSILVDVHCTVGHDYNPVYRIYVDNELLTERTWSWPSYEVLIRENIYVEFDDYKEHTLVLENCGSPNNFYFNSVEINGRAVHRCEKTKEFTAVTPRLQEITFIA